MTLGEASDKVSHITAENFWLGDSETLQLDEFKFYLNIRKIPTKALGSPYTRSTHFNHNLAMQKTIWGNNLELNFEINVTISSKM